MTPGQLVESHRFWEVAALWAAERVESEVVAARALARGVIVDGLRFESTDAKWMKADQALTGYPYVGYAAVPQAPPVLLRVEALEHLLAVVRQAAAPSRAILAVEFVRRDDFRAWLQATRQTLPSFWFSDDEREGRA